MANFVSRFFAKFRSDKTEPEQFVNDPLPPPSAEEAISEDTGREKSGLKHRVGHLEAALLAEKEINTEQQREIEELRALAEQNEKAALVGLKERDEMEARLEYALRTQVTPLEGQEDDLVHIGRVEWNALIERVRKLESR